MYRILDPLGNFIDDFILLINKLPTKHWILIVGDFNLDQILIHNFNLSQRSQYSTYIREGLIVGSCI